VQITIVKQRVLCLANLMGHKLWRLMHRLQAGIDQLRSLLGKFYFWLKFKLLQKLWLTLKSHALVIKELFSNWPSTSCNSYLFKQCYLQCVLYQVGTMTNEKILEFQSPYYQKALTRCSNVDEFSDLSKYCTIVFNIHICSYFYYLDECLVSYNLNL
jgi:hypothetical protein